MPSSAAPTVEIVSKLTVTPPEPCPSSAAGSRRHHLTPWDIAMLNTHYIQKGLLFTDIPPCLSAHHIFHRLRISLAAALQHFYPLAGRLVTEKVIGEDGEIAGVKVYIDCSGKGALLVHAVARNITAGDVLAVGKDTPSFVKSFFPLDGAISHDGHSDPLLAVQVTMLAFGDVFVACSFNHVVGDGIAFWNFFNAWAEIARSKVDLTGAGVKLSRPPVHERWFIEEENPPITLPFSDASQFIQRFSPPPLRERFFHFTGDSVAGLKSRANDESRTPTEKTDTISSFQALIALIWRSITRARRLPPEQPTSCRMAIQNRSRLSPPLSPDYFGNSIYAVKATMTAGELEAKGLGWAARRLNEAIAGHTNAAVRRLLGEYYAAPAVYSLTMFDQESVMVGGSPRFDMYGCDFGWGKAAAVRCGPANKYDGKVSAFPGREGGGSVDLLVCLAPEFMEELLKDREFISSVSAA
ncbi:putative acetyltransferase [Apostasia shenzhenica]|uniref:Putative acetyltransferase n=1 Tax=Apostasia shenzhenica TaxID=1088818 RepID=A0A2I0B9G8_9ASPA|nr:putative acetyltransferase [Apostasia shenzhenica]